MSRQESRTQRIECPSCGGRIKVPTGRDGERFRCPRCDQEVVLGESQAAVPAAAQASDSSGEISLSATPIYRAPPGTAGAHAHSDAEPAAGKGRPEAESTHAPALIMRCKVCGTRLDVPRSAIGQEVTCPDCLSALLVEENATSKATGRPPSSRPVADARDSEPDVVLEKAEERNLLADYYLQAAGDSQDKRPSANPLAGPEAAATGFGPRSKPETSQSEQRQPEKSEPDEFPLICNLCETRLYARRDQVGQQIICPDCYTVLIVAPPSKKGKTPPTAAPAPTSSKPAEDDEFRLSDVVERPKYQPLTSDAPSRQLLDQFDVRDEAFPSDVPAPRAAPPPPRGNVIGQCPNCGSRIYTTAESIDQKISCPECEITFRFKPLQAKKKEPVRVRVQEIDEPALKLSDVVREPEAKRPHHEDAEQVEARQRLAAAERELKDAEPEEPRMPKQPLITGVFRMFRDPSVISWWLFISIATGVVSGLFYGAVVNASSPNPVLQFAAVACSILGVLGGFALVLAYCMCGLGIVLDSSHGHDNIESWPTINIFEWFGASLPVLASLGWSMSPGVLIYALLQVVGAPLLPGMVAVMVSVFVLFPIVLLSVLETDSVANPASPVILSSLSKVRNGWLLFYAEATALLLLSGLAVLGADAAGSIPVAFLSAAVVGGAFVLYFRLLGRLTWLCRERFALLLADEDAE